MTGRFRFTDSRGKTLERTKDDDDTLRQRETAREKPPSES